MTDYNVTVGYRPTLGVTQQASGIVGPTGPAGAGIGSTTSINTIGIITASYFVGNGSFAQFQVTGISTFTNGIVLIGTTTATGTASQRLQVTGGASFAGVGASVGIGTTNPTQTLDVRGNLRVTGTIQNPSMIAFSVAFS
jgi:hypothetical protein